MRQTQPLLRRESFRDGMTVEWLNPAGGFQTDEAWNDPGATTIGLRLARESLEKRRGLEGGSVLFNAHDAEFPSCCREREGRAWTVALDTAAEDRAEEMALVDRRRARLWPICSRVR